GSTSFAASLKRLSSNAKPQDWCGARNCTSMAPKWQPTPVRTRSSLVSLSRRICTVCSVRHLPALSQRASPWNVGAALGMSKKRGQPLPSFPLHFQQRSRSCVGYFGHPFRKLEAGAKKITKKYPLTGQADSYRDNQVAGTGLLLVNARKVKP